jgi:tetratricopeptide (TPR) repeat protein
MHPRLLVLYLLILATLGGCASTDSGSKIYEQGLRQAEEGNLDGAIQTLKKGAASYPENARILLELARLQMEKGQPFHLLEREQMRAYSAQLEAGEITPAQEALRAANVARSKAVPWYTAARENLELVVDNEENPERLAWGSMLAMKAAVFFEDWPAAYDHLSRAIDKGHPTGQRLATWRDYQAALKEKVGKGD